MSPPRRHLTAAHAAARLGVSTKALRLYEQRGLIAPGRSAAGWRLYGPEDLARAAEILSLCRLGLSLAQIARVLDGDLGDLEDGLAAHEERLRAQARQLAATLERLQALREDIRRGQAPSAADLGQALGRDASPDVGFELPWPWGGEWFQLRDLRPLTFITGPLGSGKTRFAERLAAALPDASLLGLERLDRAMIDAQLAGDPALSARVERALCWLEEDGAERTDALRALVAALEADAPAILVVDMVEQELGEVTQQALIAHLRVRPQRKRALFLMTRSSAILDLDLASPDEAIILCPANHSPPFYAASWPGGHGHEAVATCLAAPAIRARTAGVVAMRPGGG